MLPKTLHVECVVGIRSSIFGNSKFGNASLTKGSVPCRNLPGTSCLIGQVKKLV